MGQESYGSEGKSPLHVRSLKDFLAHEKEIVGRINARQHGGRLALLDPLRLLRELRVELSEEALREAKDAYPEFFAATGRERAYDLVAQSKSHGDVRVTIEGMFPKRAP